MKCEHCGRSANLHITCVEKRKVVKEAHVCDECGRRLLREADATIGSSPSAPAASPGDTGQNAELEIDLMRIVISEKHEQQLIVFRETEGSRCFSIMIGIFEATTIDRTVKELPSPRPLTHDAWLATIGALQAAVESVCIDELRDHTYYTTLRLIQGDDRVTVDLRPSDGVIVALKAGAPILVPEKILAFVTAP